MLSRADMSFIDDSLAPSGPHGVANWRFEMSASRILGLMVAFSWLAVGCDSSSKRSDSSKDAGVAVGGSCVLSSDCDKFLVCDMGRCHEACMSSSNCSPGQSCVNTSNQTADAGDTSRASDAADAGDAGTRKPAICQLPEEADCAQTLMCSGGLLCAPDLRCRNGCDSFSDCTYGQTCTSGFCADRSDLDANGQLPQKNPSLNRDAGAEAGGPDGGLGLLVGFPDAPGRADGIAPETEPDVAADLVTSELPDADVDLVAEVDASADLAVDTLASPGP